MKLRIDKFSTFGIAKHSGKFGKALAVIQLGCEFKYLGKIYTYNMDNTILHNGKLVPACFQEVGTSLAV